MHKQTAELLKWSIVPIWSVNDSEGGVLVERKFFKLISVSGLIDAILLYISFKYIVKQPSVLLWFIRSNFTLKGSEFGVLLFF